MMADGLEFKFPDIGDLTERMAELNVKVQKRIARRATMVGIRVLRDDIRARAKGLDDPATKEAIHKNVRIQASRSLSRSQGGVAVRLGVLGGAKSYTNNRLNRRKQRAGKQYSTDGSSKNPGGDTFHWRFLEFGTSKMPAKPIFRPALAQKGDQAIQAAINAMLEDIQKEAEK